MDNPYLERGESIILTTDRVSVNSVQYDMLLTSRYLILVDIRYADFPPQKIPLLSILSVKGGKIATGDLVITLSFSDTSRTGGPGQMNLIFSRQSGEQRDRERDEWLKRLMDLIVVVRQETVGTSTPAIDQEIGVRPAMRHHIAPEMQLPHTTVVNHHPATIELDIIPDEPGTPPFSQEEPGSETRQTTQPVEGTPVETNRETASPETVPPDVPEIIPLRVSREEVPQSDSIPETAIPEEALPETDRVTASPEPVPPDIPEIVPLRVSREEVPQSDSIPETAIPEEALLETDRVTASPETVPPDMPEIVVPRVSREGFTEADSMHETEIPEEVLPETDRVTASPETVPPDMPEIVVPRVSREGFTEADSMHETEIPEEALPETGVKQASPDLSNLPVPVIVERPADQKDETEPSETVPEQGNEHEEPTPQPVADITLPGSGSPPPSADFGNRSRSFMADIAIIIIILGIAGGAILFPSIFAAPGKELSAVPTPAQPGTTALNTPAQLTSAPTPVVIPTTGVWVRVICSQDYYGRLGNPGSLRGVSGSGDHFYQVNEDNHLVQVQMYKTDNSGDTLTVEIYRNGEVIYHRATSSPMGFIELLIDATTGTPPGITPRITLSANLTTNRASNTTNQAGNQTVTATSIQARQITNQSITDTSNQTGSGSRVLFF